MYNEYRPISIKGFNTHVYTSFSMKNSPVIVTHLNPKEFRDADLKEWTSESNQAPVLIMHILKRVIGNSIKNDTQAEDSSTTDSD